MRNLLRRPPIIGYFLIGLSIVFHFIYPLKFIIMSPWNLIGILIIIFNLYITFSAKSRFDDNKVELKPGSKSRKIVKSGFFKYSRNPMYLGMVGVTFGVSILLGSLIAFIFPIIYYFILRFGFISMEERIMEKQFGNEYLKYMHEVRRWI